MSGKMVGLIIVVLIIVGGVGAYVYTQNKDDKKAATASNSQSAFKDPESDVYNGDLLDITSAGKARKCTFSTTVENVASNGTLYTDGKGRGFMEIVVDTVGTTNVLVLSDKMYGWTTAGGSTTGFTYTKEELKKMANDAGASTQASSAASSANQPFNMKCTSWSIDLSKFIVPTNIDFLSLPTSQ